MTTIRHYNPSDRRIHPLWVPIACGLVAVLTGIAAPAFEYCGTDPVGTRAWTALAAQFAHMDARHLLLNLTGLGLVCWGLQPWRTPLRDALLLGSGLAGVWTGLMLSPDVTWYRGLSGALHGLFCGYATLIILEDRRTAVRIAGLVLLAGLAAKLLIEDPPAALTGITTETSATGSSVIHPGVQTPDSKNPAEAGSSSGAAPWPVLHAAHRWGAGAGLLTGAFAGLAAIRRRRNAPLTSPP